MVLNCCLVSLVWTREIQEYIRENLHCPDRKLEIWHSYWAGWILQLSSLLFQECKINCRLHYTLHLCAFYAWWVWATVTKQYNKCAKHILKITNLTVLRQTWPPGLSYIRTCRAAAARLPWRGSAATRGARPGAASTGAAAGGGGTTGTPPPPPPPGITAKRRVKPRNLRFETHNTTLRRRTSWRRRRFYYRGHRRPRTRANRWGRLWPEERTSPAHTHKHALPTPHSTTTATDFIERNRFSLLLFKRRMMIGMKVWKLTVQARKLPGHI